MEFTPDTISGNRITAVLGTNGAGKSRKLKAFAKNAAIRSSVLYIEGGRKIQLTANFKEFGIHEQVEQIESNIKNQRSEGLGNRLNTLLGLIYKSSNDMDLRAARSIKKNKTISEESFPETPFDKVSNAFSEIFPDIELTIDEKHDTIIAIQNSNEYQINDMSDGEKQCLALLCDVLNQNFESNILVVDEPELNLHPKLAIRLWETIESKLPDASFIYATHNIMFALRSEINQIIVISKLCEPAPLKREELHQYDHLSDFIGALPSVLAYSKVLLCEGVRSNSLDEAFYRWLLSDNKIGIFPVSNCHSVISTSKSFSSLKDIVGEQVKLVGVVDGDGSGKEGDSYVRLIFDECESYLCHPEVVQKIAKCSAEESIQKIATAILRVFPRMKNTIYLRRVARKVKQDFNITIPRKRASELSDTQSVRIALRSQRDSQVSWITEQYSDSKIDQWMLDIDDREKSLKENPCTKTIEDLLEIIPGKELLVEVAIEIGFTCHATYFETILKCNSDEFNILRKIKDEIMRKLQ